MLARVIQHSRSLGIIAITLQSSISNALIILFLVLHVAVEVKAIRLVVGGASACISLIRENPSELMTPENVYEGCTD